MPTEQKHHLAPTPRKYANLVSSFLVGLIFGIGLIIAGMSNPAKVLAFLDLAGAWEPTLIVVMLGAIAMAKIGFYLVKKRSLSLLELPLHLPQLSKVDGKLIVGSIIFGIGWGIAGICPGPAVVLLGSGAPQAFWFLLAFAGGMLSLEAFLRLPALLAKRSKS